MARFVSLLLERVLRVREKYFCFGGSP